MIKPLLAAKYDPDKITLPVLCSPKLDGIRCLIIDGVAYSRKMKPIPSRFVQSELSGLHGYDGELMVTGDFNSVQSAIMSEDGEPDFTFNVFDSFVEPDLPYSERLAAVRRHRENYITPVHRPHLGAKTPLCDLTAPARDPHWHNRLRLVTTKVVRSVAELERLTDTFIAKGYEGLMFRLPDGRYKFGRSTSREGILVKVKRFMDDEGILVEFVEKMQNNNPLERDELGYAKRSSHQDNKCPTGVAGSAIVQWGGKTFSVGFGPGITEELKRQYWEDRDWLIGGPITFRYQELSKDGIPRFGKMVGFRHPLDL